MESCKGIQGPTEIFLNSKSWENVSSKINIVVLDYNSKYKTNTYEFILK